MNHELIHIKKILDTALNNFRSASDIDMTKIWDIWDGVAGDVISENAKPAAFRGGVLVIHVSSSVWLHQLEFLKNDLIKNLNRALDKNLIKQIRFKIASIYH